MSRHPSLFLSFTFGWQLILVGVSLLAIALSLLCRVFIPRYADWPLLMVIAFGGIPSLLHIFMKLIKGDMGADLLAVMTIVTAVILHQLMAAVVIILMLASGQALELWAVRRASSALLALADRMPSQAHRKTPDGFVDVPLSCIHVGESLLVFPHETCPADGQVLEGQGSMDESWLTGEPYQVSKGPGSSVLSGAINGDSLLTIQMKTLPSDSRYASIVTVLKEAEEKRPTMRRLADQAGAVFVPIALAVALAAWYISGDSMRFLAVLVIATPCPLLIAVPVALISGVSIAARRGIVIKDPSVFENLPLCRTAIFDKTGTLTAGKPVLTDIFPAEATDTRTVLQHAASLEQYSKHPLAAAVLEAAKERNLTLPFAENISEKPGQGLSGRINGKNIHITSRKKFLATDPLSEKMLPDSSSGLECVVATEGRYEGTLRFHDLPHAEGSSFVGHLFLFHNFSKVMLVSGDRESEVRYLGAMLKLTELHASQMPEQKLAIVRSEIAKAPTLFVGDGINDAPSLAAATVGIAFGSYSTVTAESAGAVILENSLKKVDELIHLSKTTRRIALQSAMGGLLLTLIGMGFAAAGMVTPILGAVLQELIDVFAVINALRLIWEKRIQTDMPTV